MPKAGSAATGPLPLHPMSFGDIMDGAFKLLKANLGTCVLITAAFLTPLDLLGAFLQRGAFSVGVLDVLRDPSLSEDGASIPIPGVDGSTITLVLALLVAPFVAGAISKVVSASYLGSQLSAGPALSATGRRAGSLIGAFLLTHLPILVPLVGAALLMPLFGDQAIDLANPYAALVPLIVVVGLFLLGQLAQLFLMAPFIGVAPAVVVENLGPVAAIKRSWRLMVPRYWPVLGIAILSGIIASFIDAILSFPLAAVVTTFGTSRVWPLIALGNLLPRLITTPFVAIVATLLYFDARIRREGFDLALTAARFADAGPGR